MNQDKALELLKDGKVEEWNTLRQSGESIPDLNDANLSGANLSGANLRNVDLGRAKLSDADLTGANVTVPSGAGRK